MTRSRKIEAQSSFRTQEEKYILRYIEKIKTKISKKSTEWS